MSRTSGSRSSACLTITPPAALTIARSLIDRPSVMRNGSGSKVCRRARARRRVSSRPMAGGHRGEYDRRVNRVIDHIREHLADELPLAALARLAAFSPFHFHRVFRAVTGETVAGFVHRLRIEKAAAALRDHPGRAVLEIALDHGFG